MWIITKLFWETTKEFVELQTYGSNALNNIFWWKSKMDNLSHEELLSLYKGIVFWACDAIGDWMAWLDRNLYKDENMLEIAKSDQIKLLDSEIIKACAIFLKTVWVVYLYKEKIWNKTVSLLLLKTWGVEPVKDSRWKVSFYRYFNWKDMFRFEADEVLMLKSFSPLFTDAWMTPLKAVATQVATDLASVEFNRLFFENGWKPGTILKHRDKIKPEIKDKYISKFKSDYMGLWNSHKLAFMDQWIEIETLNVNQKDMEMTAQRMFTIDEVLMIFRVPKPILWKSDWVWFADRWVPGYYFTEYCLKPLALQIEENLNKNLFEDEWFFSFVFMQDKDELLKEYQANTISLNEYRIWTWRAPLLDWNKLWDWTEASVEKRKSVNTYEMTKLEKGLFKVMKQSENVNLFWSDEYNQKMWVQKISRTDKYEAEFAKFQKRIWSAQEKDIVDAITSSKWVKEIKKESEILAKKKYNLMYIAMYSKFFKDFMTKEWQVSLSEISQETFAVAKVNKWIWENIDRMSTDIDQVTRKEMFAIIKQWNRDKVWAAAISSSIRSKFAQYTRKSWRIESVVRTEITRSSNKAQQTAYEQSWVVVSKQWYTAIDERRCQYCADLHWKTIKLGESFLKKWDKHLWQAIDYETINFPPRHVKCRCTERPIIERKSFEKMKEFFISKWVSILSTKWFENEQ